MHIVCTVCERFYCCTPTCDVVCVSCFDTFIFIPMPQSLHHCWSDGLLVGSCAMVHLAHVCTHVHTHAPTNQPVTMALLAGWKRTTNQPNTQNTDFKICESFPWGLPPCKMVMMLAVPQRWLFHKQRLLMYRCGLVGWLFGWLDGWLARLCFIRWFVDV